MIDKLVEPAKRYWSTVDRAHKQRELERQAARMRPRRSLVGTIGARQSMSYIFEVKRSSPSRGMMNQHIDTAIVAGLYERYGASAISVLTDSLHFGGSLEDLSIASDVASIPILRKDFVVDELQLLEARAHGADAILLIVRLLGARTQRFVAACREYDIEPLVEVHSERELETAVESGAALIGINNRDLDALSIDPSTVERLVPMIPADRIAVAESGIQNRADVIRMERAGARAVLIGSALSTATSLEQKLEDLTGCRPR